MQKKKKEELLQHYSRREPTAFLQYDGFANIKSGDPIIVPDEDYDCCFFQRTWELMHGANIRILIREGTVHQDAIRLLKKITQYVEEDREYFESNMATS